VEPKRSRTKWSAVGGQDLCRSVLMGCSHSVFTVVNEGGEVSLYFLSNCKRFFVRGSRLELGWLKAIKGS
jgi:hypothetical protein